MLSCHDCFAIENFYHYSLIFKSNDFAYCSVDSLSSESVIGNKHYL